MSTTSVDALHPSAAMERAARAELVRLGRDISRLEHRRDALAAQLEQVDQELDVVRRRSIVLRDLAGEPQAPCGAALHPSAARGLTTAGGRKLRIAAGTLLWRERQGTAIHYREWFERTRAAGFAVAGQDPLAAFLTNLRDSPAVTSAGKPGFYRLDPTMLERQRTITASLEGDLGRCEQQVRDSYLRAADRKTVAGHRDRRGRTQRDLRAARRQLAELEAIFAKT
jgi:hypothetical protein